MCKSMMITKKKEKDKKPLRKESHDCFEGHGGGGEERNGNEKKGLYIPFCLCKLFCRVFFFVCPSQPRTNLGKEKKKKEKKEKKNKFKEKK